MEGSIKTIILGAVMAVVLFFAGFLTRQCTFKKPEPQVIEHRDTVTFRDTITVTEPVEVERVVKDTMYVDVGDIVVVHDTTYVPLPREYATYKDSSYRAVVSGYMPRLEEIEVYPITQVITVQTETVYTEYKHYKFGVGIQAGYGITPGGFQPYLGLGISYNLFGF